MKLRTRALFVIHACTLFACDLVYGIDDPDGPLVDAATPADSGSPDSAPDTSSPDTSASPPPPRRVMGDYDGDGKTDRTVWRPADCKWFVANSSGAPRADYQWGNDGDVPVTGDYDGDGKADRTVWRPEDGTWYVIYSTGAPRRDVQLGLDGDIPVPGDYDGDHVTDRAVFHPSTATWLIARSTGGTQQDVWGSADDIPVPGDYNGDGKTDYAVWIRSTATWKVLNSAGAAGAAGAAGNREKDTQWGAPGDIPVPSDYDGDGKTDYAIWRPSTAIWRVQHSNGEPTIDVQWGALGDIPVPGDYDGDGKTDYAVWRPSMATWFVVESAGGPRHDVGWGVDGDIPLPNLPYATLPWRPLVNQPTFAADVPLLLTDGTVMVRAADDTAWWRLVPDVNGSYLNGTWSLPVASPATSNASQPSHFASAVLADGRVLIAGGKYHSTVTSGSNGSVAIFDPVGSTWTAVPSPPGWTSIGSPSSVVLADGRVMLSNVLLSQQAILDTKTLTWTITGTGKADGYANEAWSLLPSGKVLTVDATNGLESEVYDPSSGAWTSAGSTGHSLVNAASEEIGPALLLPEGRVFVAGGSSHTALYSPTSGWTPGPDFPDSIAWQLNAGHGAAALLPNGHVLLAVSPGAFQTWTRFLDFDGSKMVEIANTPNAINVSSYQERFVILPNGQLLETDGSNDVQIYPSRGAPDPSWAPTITSVPATLTRGTTQQVQGTQFNGLSQAVAYGANTQSASNYPLVRITNDATGHVFYARTHDVSTMAVATGAQVVSTFFDIPSAAEMGASHLVVVTNGIASSAAAVTVR